MATPSTQTATATGTPTWQSTTTLMTTFEWQGSFYTFTSLETADFHPTSPNHLTFNLAPKGCLS